MVVSYELAQLSTTARKLPRAGAALLVLGSGNVDEILRGYYTKYDASSADISPLGSISKIDIKRFQRWVKDQWDLPILEVSFVGPILLVLVLILCRSSLRLRLVPNCCHLVLEFKMMKRTVKWAWYVIRSHKFLILHCRDYLRNY
jgi:hypothetical protein